MTTMASPAGRIAEWAARRQQRSTFAFRIWLAKNLTGIYTVAGFGLLDVAAFRWFTTAGYVAVGLSCLILGHLVETPEIGGDRR